MISVEILKISNFRLIFESLITASLFLTTAFFTIIFGLLFLIFGILSIPSLVLFLVVDLFSCQFNSIFLENIDSENTLIENLRVLLKIKYLIPLILFVPPGIVGVLFSLIALLATTCLILTHVTLCCLYYFLFVYSLENAGNTIILLAGGLTIYYQVPFIVFMVYIGSIVTILLLLFYNLDPKSDLKSHFISVVSKCEYHSSYLTKLTMYIFNIETCCKFTGKPEWVKGVLCRYPLAQGFEEVLGVKQSKPTILDVTEEILFNEESFEELTGLDYKEFDLNGSEVKITFTKNKTLNINRELGCTLKWGEITVDFDYDIIKIKNVLSIIIYFQLGGFLPVKPLIKYNRRGLKFNACDSEHLKDMIDNGFYFIISNVCFREKPITFIEQITNLRFFVNDSLTYKIPEVILFKDIEKVKKELKGKFELILLHNKIYWGVERVDLVIFEIMNNTCRIRPKNVKRTQWIRYRSQISLLLGEDWVMRGSPTKEEMVKYKHHLESLKLEGFSLEINFENNVVDMGEKISENLVEKDKSRKITLKKEIEEVCKGIGKVDTDIANMLKEIEIPKEPNIESSNFDRFNDLIKENNKIISEDKYWYSMAFRSCYLNLRDLRINQMKKYSEVLLGGKSTAIPNFNESKKLNEGFKKEFNKIEKNLRKDKHFMKEREKTFDPKQFLIEEIKKKIKINLNGGLGNIIPNNIEVKKNNLNKLIELKNMGKEGFENLKKGLVDALELDNKFDILKVGEEEIEEIFTKTDKKLEKLKYNKLKILIHKESDNNNDNKNIRKKEPRKSVELSDPVLASRDKKKEKKRLAQLNKENFFKGRGKDKESDEIKTHLPDLKVSTFRETFMESLRFKNLSKNIYLHLLKKSVNNNRNGINITMKNVGLKRSNKTFILKNVKSELNQLIFKKESKMYNDYDIEGNMKRFRLMCGSFVRENNEIKVAISGINKPGEGYILFDEYHLRMDQALDEFIKIVLN